MSMGFKLICLSSAMRNLLVQGIGREKKERWTSNKQPLDLSVLKRNWMQSSLCREQRYLNFRTGAETYLRHRYGSDKFTYSTQPQITTRTEVMRGQKLSTQSYTPKT